MSRQPGYYPGFSTLDQQAFWDEATRKVVLDRVENVPPIRFFSDDELQTMEALADRIVPQDDRPPERRIAVVPHIDKRLFTQTTDGYRYREMPHDWDAYHLGLRGIDAVAGHMHGKRFAELSNLQKDQVLQTLHDANPPAGDEIWQQMEVHRFWLMLVQDCIEGYYQHPWAWDEIGFGGPAYPRGYFRLEKGLPEPWEVEEQRYEWRAPEDSLSDVYRPVGGADTHHASPGQEGSH